jgi:tetratricopeptide (TPR) repeat protein
MNEAHHPNRTLDIPSTPADSLDAGLAAERAVALAREAEQRKHRKVQLALAAALVALLLGGGAFAWWRNEQAQAGRERDARNAEAVAALLRQAEEALVGGDAARAAVALDAAKKRSAEGGAEKQAQRLRGLEADLTLVRDLDAVDQFAWTVVENQFPNAEDMAARIREALARFGADPEAESADDAAARVSASVVRERIVSALDWLLGQKTIGVRALLRRVDADPYRDAIRDAVLADDGAQFAQLADQPAALEQPPEFTAHLGGSQGLAVQRRRQLLQAALSHRPGDLRLLMMVGETYPINQEEGANERLRWFQAAVAAAPAMPAAHINLAFALKDKGQLDEAITCLRKAIEIDPKYAPAHYNLGVALKDKGQVDEAIACYQKAIALDPKFPMAHVNLGAVLLTKGQVDEAIACDKKAIALDPKDAKAHVALGTALGNKGQVDEAIACYQKAIELDPKFAPAHVGLGAALWRKGQLDEAIACDKKAIELDPKDAGAHYNLGYALKDKGRLDEAIACWRKAIEIDPKHAWAHNDLGAALGEKGQLDEAIAFDKKAIALDPKNARAHLNLGAALGNKGQLDEAIACFRKAIELDPMNAGARANLARAERLAAAQDKLPAFQNGSYKPASNAERLDLAKWCRIKKLHHTATGLYAAAFAADPKLADDLTAAHRYSAACSAALAATGQGEDAAKLDDQEKARLRKQSLDWLRADLVLRGKQLESGKPGDRAAVQQALQHWQQDTDLAGLRNAAALTKLPAEERAAWAKLWADVAALLKKAETPAQTESK